MNDETIETKTLIDETCRLCQRYIDEVVLPFSLCPWAASALQNGRVQMSVITDVFTGQPDLVTAAQRVRSAFTSVKEERVELVLVLLPQAQFKRLEMDDLLRAIRARDTSGSPSQSELGFALAAFHPEASPDRTTPERFIPYLRRSPDPMIQGVRTSALAKIEPTQNAGTAYFDLENMDVSSLNAPSTESLRARIARANLKTVEQEGLNVLEDRYEAIQRDHQETRKRLLGRNV